MSGALGVAAEPQADQPALQTAAAAVDQPASEQLRAGNSPGGTDGPLMATVVPEREIPLNLDEAPPGGHSPGKSGRFIVWLVSLGWKLGIVLLLAYGSLNLLRRFLPGAAAGASAPGLEVRRTVSLGPGRSIHLLEIEGRRLLIASTGQQIALLADLTADAVDRTVRIDPASPAEGGFQVRLEELLDADGQSVSEAAPGGEDARGVRPLPEPEVLTDEELREEVRRSILSFNRSAEGIVRLQNATGKGDSR